MIAIRPYARRQSSVTSPTTWRSAWRGRRLADRRAGRQGRKLVPCRRWTRRRLRVPPAATIKPRLLGTQRSASGLCGWWRTPTAGWPALQRGVFRRTERLIRERQGRTASEIEQKRDRAIITPVQILQNRPIRPFLRRGCGDAGEAEMALQRRSLADATAAVYNARSASTASQIFPGAAVVAGASG